MLAKLMLKGSHPLKENRVSVTRKHAVTTPPARVGCDSN